jgi:P2 family phage contractile tail tube protein
MAARDVLKNFNLFVDGRGYAGQVQDYTPPDLTAMTEDFRAGGMDGPIAIPLGIEALTASFSLLAYDADTIAQWGVSVGGVVPLTIRGALESYDGSVKPVVHLMRGRITSLSRGTWTPGAIAPLTVTMRPDFYSETIDGVVISVIDLENMIRIIGGVDQLASQRAALGI